MPEEKKDKIIQISAFDHGSFSRIIALTAEGRIFHSLQSNNKSVIAWTEIPPPDLEKKEG